MLQLILEQLVNGASIAAISTNVASQAAFVMPGVKVFVQDLPKIKFIRSLQTIIRIIVDTLEDYCIGKVQQRDQIFSDNMGRRQTDLHHLVIGVINEEHLHPLIVSTSIILIG